MVRFVASELLSESLEKHKIHLSVLVADTGIWCNPAVHRRLLESTSVVAMSPNVRRARAGEKTGDVCDGIRLDSNNYANVAIKRAVGLHRLQLIGFEACHIWPLTCYDPRFHTAPANLVLLPRAVASLSDHDLEIQAALQYRALELYDWWPEGFERPVRPEFYPEEWRPPMPDPAARTKVPRRIEGSRAMSDDEEIELLTDRLVRWSAKPELFVHTALAVLLLSNEKLTRKEWVERVRRATGSRNAYGATAQLFTQASSGYGRVLQDRMGVVAVRPELEQVARSLPWQLG